MTIIKYAAILTFVLSSLCSKGGDTIHTGVVSYEIILSGSVFIADVELPTQKFTEFEDVAFKNNKSIIYKASGSKMPGDINKLEALRFRNTATSEMVQHIKKFGVEYSKIIKIKNRLVRVIDKEAIVCGLRCKEIIFLDQDNVEKHGWATSSLPAAAGCVIIQDFQPAIIKYTSSIESCTATKINTTIDVPVGLVTPVNKKTVLRENEKSYSYASGKAGEITSGKVFPEFKFSDINKRIFTNASFKNYDATIVTVWLNEDWKKYGVTFQPNDFNVVQSLDLFAVRNKLNVLCLSITDDVTAELLLTRPLIKTLKKTKTVPSAFQWINTTARIKTFPTIILIDKIGRIKQVYRYTSGEEELSEITSRLLNVAHKF
jgi:hypothetical protein